MSELLRVTGLTKRFGGVIANQDISFDVRKGEILGVIGPNGAGKSTLFDLITGFQKADAGTVVLDGRDITGLRPDRIARMGVGRTFQKLKPFPDLTLLENIMVGALSRTANVHAARDQALEAIAFVVCCTSVTASRANSAPVSASGWRWPAPSHRIRGCC